MLTLSLGIGATTVIFSVVYSILVAGLPFDGNFSGRALLHHGGRSTGLVRLYPASEFVQAGN